MGFVSALMDEGAITRAEAKTLIASSLGGLWQHGFVEDELETITRSFAGYGFWYGGWRQIRSTLRFEGKKMTMKSHERLKRLEVALRPTNLVQWIEAIVLNSDNDIVDLTDNEDFANSDITDAYARLQHQAEVLGEQAAVSSEDFQAVLARLVSGGHGRQYSFGVGLARAAAAPETTWFDLEGAYAQTDPSERNRAVMRGYLSELHLRSPELTSTLLDRALANALLAPIFPSLQSAVPIDAQALVRLHRCLADGHTNAEAFRVLALGSVLNQVSPSCLRTLLCTIADHPGGVSVALDILHMQLSSDGESSCLRDDLHLREAGLELLRRWTVACGGCDYQLHCIVTAYVTGDDGAAVAGSLCEQIKTAMHADIGLRQRWTQTLDALFLHHGLIALEEFFGSEADHGLQVFSNFTRLHGNPLRVIPPADIIAWCNNEPERRYPMIAEAIPFFLRDSESASLQISELSYLLLQHAPDPAEVIRAFAPHISPSSWSGSRAQIMQTRADLLRKFTAHADPRIAAATRQVLHEADRVIRNEQASEECEARMPNERFEATVM